jgi:hypothetical protein
VAPWSDSGPDAEELEELERLKEKST